MRTLNIAIVSIFPDMFKALTEYGVIGRAVDAGIAQISFCNPRDFANNKHNNVDDRPYGGGPGMVMMAEPLLAAIRNAKANFPESKKVKTIYLSPQGQRFDQAAAQRLAENEQLVFVAGRYEGIDERVIDLEIDEEWSIGDYVLSGGELPTTVMLDSILRLVPGVLGHEDSAVEDSFVGGLLDCPHYTRPEEVEGRKVPAELLGGNHQKIEDWRLQQSLGRTWLRRPDLLEQKELSDKEQRLLKQFKSELPK